MAEPLAFQVSLPLPIEAAEAKVTEALRAEGFGVLTRINVRATLREKLGEEFRPYLILGACNPSLAHRALSNEPLIGVLLPCNVTVEQQGDQSLISIANPQALLAVGSLANSPVVCDVAAEARLRLERVADGLRR
jgi:uncharacterized protein (DUF302 family)